MNTRHWLMKAEPDSRIVKGKDVKFSVDDFKRVETTPWEGVRNHEAKNLMKEMKVGDKVLFYHSNCKIPGIAAFAEVTKEAYPDYTAWDKEHPYFDPKTDPAKPKWEMVDVTFRTRAAHHVPLALLRHIAALSSSAPPDELVYLEKDDVRAIKEMALVTRGRLSVQRVELAAWTAVERLAEQGGWDGMSLGGKAASKRKPAGSSKAVSESKTAAKGRKGIAKDVEPESNVEEGEEAEASAAVPSGPTKTGRGRAGKRKAEAEVLEQAMDDGNGPRRRSTRLKK